MIDEKLIERLVTLSKRDRRLELVGTDLTTEERAYILSLVANQEKKLAQKNKQNKKTLSKGNKTSDNNIAVKKVPIQSEVEAIERANAWLALQESELLERIKSNTVIIETDDVIITIEPKGDPKRIFSDKLRSEIYIRDNATCQICGVFVTISNYDCDHIYPYSLGGTTILDNGQCTCKNCNRSKGNKIT